MKKKPLNKQFTWNAWYFIIAIIGILVLQEFFAHGQRFDVIPYSTFQDQLRTGKIAAVTISNNHIQGTYKEPQKDGKKAFVTTRIEAPPELVKELQQHNVQVSGAVESHFLATLLSWIVPVLLFFGVWYFVFRRFAQRGGMGGGGLMSIGKSKAKIYVEQNTKVSFNDVAGVDEAKEELREIVGFLKNPGHYRRLGGRVPKGVLLVGPPGTGKTLLARAVAGEAGVPFFSISGAEFVEMFVGVGAARVRDLFEQARQKAPAIIFIDELDALGRARGSYPTAGGNDEKEQTLNQLLAELDGFDPSTGLVLIGATNRPEILDPALLRAGRFDRQVLVDRPDRMGRVAILKVHLKKVRLAGDADPEKIAALTPGFTGADLANLVNEAALLATRHDKAAVGMEDFTSAIERIVAGLEKRNRILNPQEREVIAFHEMGHALTSLSLPGVDTVHKVSIIPRGIGALGYTIQRPTEDRFLMTREELENKMAVLLGGRAAESVVFGRFSTGAADDLQKVTDIARNMVTRYGMSDELGHVTYERDNRTFLAGPTHMEVHERQYSEATAREIDNVVKRIVDDAFERTTALLRSQREILDRCAHALLEKETLNEQELLELTGKRSLAAAQ